MFHAFRIYARALAANRWQIGGVVLLAGAASLFEGSAIVLLIPIIETELGGSGGNSFAVQLLLDLLQSLNVSPDFVSLVLVFAGFAGLSACLTWCSNIAIYWTITSTDARMRIELFKSVTDLRWTRLSGESAGAIVKALNNDPTQSGIGVHNLLMAGAAFISVVAYGTIAILLSWQLTAISFAFALAVLPVYVWQVHLGREASLEASEQEGVAVARGTEAVSNAKLLFAQGLRSYIDNLYAGDVTKYQRAKFRQDRLVETSRVTFELVAVLFVVGLLLYIAWTDDVSLSAGLVFLAIFYRLAPRIVTVQGCYFRAVNYASWIANWAGRVDDYTGAAQPGGGNRTAPRYQTQLEIRNGSFHYSDRHEDGQVPDTKRRGRGISGIDFILPRGGAAAITGPSGHGKSTLIDAITGLLPLDSGDAFLDGVAFRDLDIGAWQRRIGLVPQDAPLFYGTIRDNITLGDAAIAPDQFARAVAVAEVDEFAAELSEGYDTMVGERGAQLSGGQRQRVALARALFRQPDLLILDEATSALDRETAKRVVENLKEFKGEISILVVSHEPSLLGLADRRYEMREGRLQEA